MYQDKTTDYFGNVIYENGNLSRILTTERYITLEGTAPTYHYFLKDHQGNNRVVVNQNGAVEQVNHYYPFGGVFAEGIDDTKQPYKYNGKELDRTNGLEWYDYGARMMDGALGRFSTVDQFCEKYYSLSPYQYAANNPVNNIDSNGDSIITTIPTMTNGNMVNQTYTYNQGSQGNYGFFDSNGQLYSGNNLFISDMTIALGHLRKGTVGKSLVNELIASSKTVEISNRKSNQADRNGKFILWNPNEISGGIDQKGGTTRPIYISLGHEMAHIQDIWKGTYDGRMWTGTIPNAEKYATHVENQLRSEHNLPLRTHSGMTTSGLGDPATPLLKSGTSVSLHFKRIVTLGGVSVHTTPYIY